MTYENLTLQTEPGVEIITINRPSKLNALNSGTIQELSTALKASNANPTVRVIVLTGSGKKAFVAGADISEFAHFSVAKLSSRRNWRRRRCSLRSTPPSILPTPVPAP